MNCRRAKNREAARRSRRRKSERFSQLSKDVKTLQQENLLLLKCIEEFTQKTIACKEEQLSMRKEIESYSSLGESKTLQLGAQTDPLPKLTEPYPSSLKSARCLENTELDALNAQDVSGSQTSARKMALLEHQTNLSSKGNSPREVDDGRDVFDSQKSSSHQPPLLAALIKETTPSTCHGNF